MGAFMDISDYKEDLEYLYIALLKHPSIINDKNKKAELDTFANGYRKRRHY